MARGDATILGSVAGAVATGAPLVVAATAQDFGNAVIYIGAICVALTAIGVATGKVWRLVRTAVHQLDKIEDLTLLGDRVELRQLAMAEQIRDISQQLEAGMEHSRRILQTAEANRAAAEQHGIEGLRPLPER